MAVRAPNVEFDPDLLKQVLREAADTGIQAIPVPVARAALDRVVDTSVQTSANVCKASVTLCSPGLAPSAGPVIDMCSTLVAAAAKPVLANAVTREGVQRAAHYTIDRSVDCSTTIAEKLSC
jgi:hypothetical protein